MALETDIWGRTKGQGSDRRRTTGTSSAEGTSVMLMDLGKVRAGLGKVRAGEE